MKTISNYVSIRIILILRLINCSYSFGQSIIPLPIKFNSQLNSSANFWLYKEFGLSVSSEQCTILTVDNNLTRDVTEQFELNVALRHSLNGILSVNVSFKYIQHYSIPCTFAFYNLPTINWLGLLNPRFIYKLPGSVYNSFHVLNIYGNILGIGNLADDDLRQFETKIRTSRLAQQYVGSTKEDDKEVRNLKLMHHFVIVKYSWLRLSANNVSNATSIPSKLNLSVSTFNTWFNKTIALTNFASTHLTIYSDEPNSNDESFHLLESKPAHLFPDKWHNLNGGYLNVATTPDTSQKSLDEFIRTNKIETGGYTAAGIYYILQYLNVTPTFTISSANAGYKNPTTNKWVGNVGELLDGNVLMISGLSYVHDKFEVVTYSQPYHYIKITFITSLPKESPTPSGSFDFLSRPFDDHVWYLSFIASVGIVTAIFIKKFCVDKVQSLDSDNSVKVSAGTLLDLLTRPFFDQANYNNSLRTTLLADNFTRCFIAIGLLALIILVNGYRSSSISILSAPRFTYPPKTFLELVNSNYRIGSVLYNESFFGAAFNNLNNRVGMEVRSRVKGYSFFNPDCYLEVGKSGNEDICMTISAFLELAANKFLTDTNGMKLYKMAEDSLFSVPVGVAVPIDFPHLVENMNKIVSRYFDTGLTQQIYKYESMYSSKLGRRLSKNGLRSTTKSLKEEQADWGNGLWFTNEQSLKQGLNHFVTILLVGFGMSLILFSLEFVVFYLPLCMNRLKVAQQLF